MGEEKRRIEEQRELMEKSAEEIQAGFKMREAVLGVRDQKTFFAHKTDQDRHTSNRQGNKKGRLVLAGT